MSTKLIMHVHLYDFDTARSLEKRIMFHLSERLKFDDSANDSINIIRRKSASLHITEIAIDRTSKCVAYFSASDAQGNILNPIQYYMACTNHAGNLLCHGDFQQSFEYSKHAIHVLNNYSSLVFPKAFIPSNNYIVTGLLSASFQEEDAIRLYDALLQDSLGQGDHFLLKTNQAVVHALKNEIQVADVLFQGMFDVMQKSDDMDDYYQYYVLINWVGVKFILREKGRAVDLLALAKKKLPRIPESVYLIKRHELLEETLLSDAGFDGPTWYKHLLKKYPYQLGKGWNFFGLGFLFSDLQFWSES